MGYTFFKLAYDVLEQSNKPLSVQEIWENANKMGLVAKLSSSGKTPINTLSAQLSVDIKHNTNPTFKKVSDKPSRYILNKQSNTTTINNISEDILFVNKPTKSVQNKLV